MARIPCPNCGNSFGSNFSLQRHIETIHQGQRDFTCQDCGEAFAQQNQLQRHHMRNHQDVEIRCRVCRQMFASMDAVRRHIEQVHGRNRPFKCVSCDKSFAQMSDLKR